MQLVLISLFYLFYNMDTDQLRCLRGKRIIPCLKKFKFHIQVILCVASAVHVLHFAEIKKRGDTAFVIC